MCRLFWTLRPQAIFGAGYFQILITIDRTLNTIYLNRFQFLQKNPQSGHNYHFVRVGRLFGNFIEFFHLLKYTPIGINSKNETTFFSFIHFAVWFYDNLQYWSDFESSGAFVCQLFAQFYYHQSVVQINKKHEQEPRDRWVMSRRVDRPPDTPKTTHKLFTNFLKLTFALQKRSKGLYGITIQIWQRNYFFIFHENFYRNHFWD